MVFDGVSNDTIGWIAAFIGCLGFGSFAVPMKGKAANSVDVDPLVFQTYKTAMSFITCWFVLLLGVKFTFTPIGIISGLLWVPAGTVGIYGVRNAGIAICVGTWSGVTVLVSFIWGLFIFGEQVRSRVQTLFAVILMLIGLSGMAYFSSSKKQKEQSETNTSCALESDMNERLLNDCESENVDDVEKNNVELKGSSLLDTSSSGDDFDDEVGQITGLRNPQEEQQQRKKSETVNVCGLEFSRFTLGLIGAVYNGALGGSAIVPMHYAKTHGLEFVISFAIGATLVTAVIWFLRFLYHLRLRRSVQSAWGALPSFHLKVMWFPGAIAGTLWSIGNICSILSVTYLGEGIGMSVVQSAMMVSGLWGIFYFREIRGKFNIICWFMAAFVTLLSIIFLSHEHEAIKSP